MLTQIFLGKNAFLYKKSAYVLHLATVASGELAFLRQAKKSRRYNSVTNCDGVGRMLEQFF